MEHCAYPPTLTSVTMPPISKSIGSHSCSEEITDEISGVDAHAREAHGHGSNSAENNVMAQTSQEDELARVLEHCASVLQSGLQQL